MSFYYKQEFTSAEPLFAEVKEELSSYFASGAIDDVMFPKWTEHCLKRFRKSAFKIAETVLQVKDYKACLPDDFNAVREAWACTTFQSPLYESATSQYYQRDCRIDPYSSPNVFPDNFDPTGSCEACGSQDPNACVTNYNVVHKVNSAYFFSFTRTFLLTPGNLNAKKHCGDCCPNIGAATDYSFDVVNGNLVTNFAEGTVHLVYYADPNVEGDQMVPDNFWVQDYIRKFITYKCFSKLSNIITDETFNQIMVKKREADQEQGVALIIAETELKKQTAYEKIRQIKKSYEQNDKYRLPGDQSYLNEHRR